MYAPIKRDKWNEICSSLNSRSSNNKLWKLVKGISTEQSQFLKSTTLFNLQMNSWLRMMKKTANILGEYYQLISSLNFTGNCKYAQTMANNVVHSCRSNPHVGPTIFNRALVKYYSKLSSLGFQNRTSKFLRSWNSHQRLKRGSPLRYIVSKHLVASSIEQITAYLRLLTLLRFLMEFTFMLTSLSKLANKMNLRAT
ncbi:uncharacterized protein TNCV_3877231 [Trichonephila clavipes]|uniref:Uncharacterized protein n=1 Tax=Trichonephila clavipes TaxID=2585209 RepID=A0A8X6SX80_TRICX|nr:uncharacterized protein TNCV_3877231 [Trichonephila clavipes]